MSSEYWMPGDAEELESARSYGELFVVAERILSRMPRPRGQMCGPISTGGAGSIEANLKRFEIAHQHILDTHGALIFNQMPIEPHMHRIWKETEPDTYSMKLLEEFYYPIFSNRLVDTMYFLPDWQTSRGATWEHEQGKRFNIDIIYLPEDLFVASQIKFS